MSALTTERRALSGEGSRSSLVIGFLIIAAMALGAAVYAGTVTAKHAPVFEECHQQCGG